jgi:hypothetical protein
MLLTSTVFHGENRKVIRELHKIPGDSEGVPVSNSLMYSIFWIILGKS